MAYRARPYRFDLILTAALVALAAAGCNGSSTAEIDIKALTSTADNLRLRCRGHNMLHAEAVFGRGHMDQYRRPILTVAGDRSSTDEVHRGRDRRELTFGAIDS